MSQFRFYIFHKDLKQPVRLKYDPEGWDSGGVTRKRDPRWHGVFFEYTQKLRFVKDGRNLVAYFYEQYGIEAELVLIRQRYINSQRKYRTDYTGRFNLTTLEISELYAECNIEQSGFLQKFKNRQDVKVNLSSLVTQSGKAIEANSSETETIELHSKTLRKDAIDGLLDGLQPTAQMEIDEPNYVLWPWSPVLDEIQERFDYLMQFNSASPETDFKYNFKVAESGNYTFNAVMHIGFVVLSGLDLDWTVSWYIKTGRPGNYTTQQIGTTQSSGGLTDNFQSSTSISDYTVALEKDDEIYIYGIVQGDGIASNTTVRFDRLENYTLSVRGDTLVPATTAPIFLIHEAFARVVESITDEADSFRSEYYGRTDSEPTAYDADGEGSLRGILNGSLIRGFPLADRPPTTSFKELFDMARAVDGIGVGIKLDGLKQRIYVAPLVDFYKPQRVVKFNFVKDIRKAVATEYYYNRIDAGYDRWNNEQLNNLDEFLTKREFVLPLTQIDNTLALRSPIIASGYTIEFVRRDRYIQGTTKDNDRDNDNFIIQLRRDDGSLVTDKDEDFAELNNIISPETIYNAKLSVMRNLKRNGRYIRSALFHQNDEFIKMTFGEGNTEFNSRLTTEANVLSEKEIKVSDLDRPLWIPEYYFFKVSPTFEQEEALNLEPCGLIEFSTTDKDHKKGYLVESNVDDESGLTEFKVLRANQ
ncbi:MAG: hypothetical protein KF803_08665 [Cyclobacteriaceae bacterium]|nr:hypothetical protein [Cyclobacteriaceae bacterium]